MAVINPKLGKFNVTAKGGVNENEYFDWSISKPYLILMGLGLMGFAVGASRLLWEFDPDVDTIVLNLIWTVYNLVMLGAAIAVAFEAKQVRVSHRVSMKIPAAVRTEGGRSYVCTTTDYSDGGVGVSFPAPVSLAVGENVKLALRRGLEEFQFDTTVTLNRGNLVGLQFAPMSVQQSVDFVQCTFARADSWVVWGDKRKLDKPLASIREVGWMGMRGFLVLGSVVRAEFKRRLALLGLKAAAKSSVSKTSP
jgi:cellulose synthase (UDP-forming)